MRQIGSVLNFFKQQKAASSTEYGLLIGMIALGAILSIDTFGQILERLFTVIANEINVLPF